MDPASPLRQSLAQAIADACASLKYEVSAEEAAKSIIAAKPEFGDIGTTIAFDLAKKLKANPAEIAGKIAKAVKIEKKLIKEIKVVGPYVNFIYSDSFLMNVFDQVMAEKEGFGKGEPKGKKAIVEYPSVNPNKPWHIGHLRNALLGNSIANIIEFSGYNVERQNFINDLGLQVSQSIWGYLTMPKPDGWESEKFDLFIGKQYVEISKNPEKIEAEVRSLMKRLDSRDPKSSKMARDIAERVVNAQLQTAFDYGIYEDVLLWESDLIEFKLYEGIFKKMLKSGIFVKETEGDKKGCIVAHLDEAEFPSVRSDEKVIVRSDGVPTYTAKDIALAMWKFGLAEGQMKYKVFTKQPNGKSLYMTSAAGRDMPNYGKADLVINVIGVEQSYLQVLIKYILKKMGYPQAENYVHIPYEHVTLPEASFSGREGTWLGFSADDLMAEGVKRAAVEVEKRMEKSGIKPKDSGKIAKQIANAAIKFSILRVSPNKKVTFEWDKAISFEGDTGPYLQYACVRAKRILEKMPEGEKPTIRKTHKLSDSERQLAKALLEFPSIVQKAASDYQSNYIAEYSLRLSDAFSRFYETSPVIQAEENDRKVRAAMVLSALTILQSSLGLLGIGVPEKM
jgi:arginyl-tRNA synthetase